MKKYTLVQTNKFISEYTQVIKYIKFELHNVSAAANLRNEVFEALKNIEIMPEAFSKIEIRTNKKHILRWYQCKNYTIFYEFVDDTVILYSFLYSNSDTKNHLKELLDE